MTKNRTWLATLVAAVVVAAVGVFAAATHEDESGCDTLRHRLAAVEATFSDEAPASWEELLRSQAARDARDQVLRDLAAEGCS